MAAEWPILRLWSSCWMACFPIGKEVLNVLSFRGIPCLCPAQGSQRTGGDFAGQLTVLAEDLFANLSPPCEVLSLLLGCTGMDTVHIGSSLAFQVLRLRVQVQDPPDPPSSLDHGLKRFEGDWGRCPGNLGIKSWGHQEHNLGGDCFQHPRGFGKWGEVCLPGFLICGCSCRCVLHSWGLHSTLEQAVEKGRLVGDQLRAQVQVEHLMPFQGRHVEEPSGDIRVDSSLHSRAGASLTHCPIVELCAHPPQSVDCHL